MGDIMNYIEKHNLTKEEICIYLARQIKSKLMNIFENNEITQMAQYICTEFNIPISQLGNVLENSNIAKESAEASAVMPPYQTYSSSNQHDPNSSLQKMIGVESNSDDEINI